MLNSPREITREDDARMEAEAKKMTEGYYRRKRHGNEFMSDEEDEDGKVRKFSKKQRRQRKLDREDGLYKIGRFPSKVRWVDTNLQAVKRISFWRPTRLASSRTLTSRRLLRLLQALFLL